MSNHPEQCDWETEGQRCRFPGSVSHSVTGGGPWYCAGHARSSDLRSAARIVRESMSWRSMSRDEADAMHAVQVEAWLEERGLARTNDETRSAYIARLRDFVRSTLAHLGSVEGSKGWAKAIVDRYVGGIPVPDIALRMACEVLGRDPDVLRAERDAAATTVSYVHEPV